MAITVSAKAGGEFELIPEDTHRAVCVGVVELGTQFNATFNNFSKKCAIIFELPDVRIELETESGTKNLPRNISMLHTQSIGKKANLRKVLESWRGRAFTEEELKGFDLLQVLGTTCNLQVLHVKRGEKTFADIQNVMAKIKGQENLRPEGEFITFGFDSHEDVPDNVPSWMAEMIHRSSEWEKRTPDPGQFPKSSENMDDVPF